MRKILIPTDFTVESLQLVEYAILNFPETKLDIIMVAGYKIPDTRWGIMHFNPREQVRKLCSDAYVDSKRRLLQEHKKNIECLSFELFTGINSFAFINFLEQIEAEDAIVPKNESLYCDQYRWFDASRFIKSNVKNVVEIPVESTKRYRRESFLSSTYSTYRLKKYT
ncbi:hypothetical protein SAMN03097699_0312 [Flavobacteriaceae bacterium MAR_2010_188]|nr:hypothetical protein SAMN03097699_0312 [Flavobacteriaceae bacterium MAR_2010_188]